MNIKNKLGRVVGIAAALVIGWLSLVGMASASAAQPAAARTVSQHVRSVSLANNGPVTGCVLQTSNGTT